MHLNVYQIFNIPYGFSFLFFVLKCSTVSNTSLLHVARFERQQGGGQRKPKREKSALEKWLSFWKEQIAKCETFATTNSS